MNKKAAKGFAFLMLCGMVIPQWAPAASTYMATPSNYRELLRKLQPGDTLLLGAGNYLNGLPVHGIAGLPDLRITIKGAQSTPSARFVARQNSNTVSIADSAYVEISNLEIDGENIPVHAVVAEGWAKFAHDITLDRLYIHGHGANQQINGISTKCPAWNWMITRNTIVGAGTGMYLGQSDGTAPFIAGVLEHNTIVDTIGYNVQIKHQKERPRLAGMPQNRSVTIIRNNVFSKANGGAGGKLARPNVLVGHWPRSGDGSHDSYAIYGNFFYQNPTEALFQGEGNVAFYSNVLVNTLGDGINIRPHNDVPRQIEIFRNTVLAAQAGIKVIEGDSRYSQRVTGNAVFANEPIVGGDQNANVTGPLADASAHLVRPFAPLGMLDLAPKSGMFITAPIRNPLQPDLPDSTRDFDGRAYDVSVAGAYVRPGIKRLLIEFAH